MTREEHISEIAKDLCSKNTICTCTDRNGRCSIPQRYASIVYDLGYRKVAEANGNTYYCSSCGEECTDTSSYCPHCGIKITEGKYIESEPSAKWKFWEGWIGNHDYRIEDATCSKCGYVHLTVRRTFGSRETTKEVLNKLKEYCPNCKSKMELEECYRIDFCLVE